MSLWNWLLFLVLSQVPFWLGYGLIAWALWSTYRPCPHCGSRMRRDRRRCPHCTGWVTTARRATCAGSPS